MARRYYSNVAAVIYLRTAMDTLITSIDVSNTAGGAKATPTGWPTTFPFFAVIDRDTPDEELVLVTAEATGTLTVTRGAGLGYGAASKTHALDAPIVHVASAADFDEANAHIQATAAVHGLAAGSAVVGTTDAQTLDNKTLLSPLVRADATDTPGLRVDAVASQTSNIQEWRASDGTTIPNRIASDHLAHLNGVTVAGPLVEFSRATVNTGHPDQIGFVVRGVAAQNSDLQQWRSSAGIEARITAVGNLVAPNVTGAWTDYTPAWTSTGTGQPALGDGTLAGRFKAIGKTVTFTFRLTIGTTTTFGDGNWIFGLPVAGRASPAWTATVHLEDVSAPTRHMGVTGQQTASSVFVRNYIGAAVSGASPWTWAVNDLLTITGTYEAV